MQSYTLSDRYGERRFLAADDKHAIETVSKRVKKLGLDYAIIRRDSDGAIAAEFKH